MYKTLLFSIVLVLIPLLSYSQKNTLPINEFQIRTVLKDKYKLNYLLQEQEVSDSLIVEQSFLIKNLKEQILSYKTIDKARVSEVEIYQRFYKKERNKSRLILYSSGMIIGTITYLYIRK